MEIDKNLIQRCIKKERKAQQEMYDKLYPYIMGICYRYFVSKEDTQDIFNMCMFKILTNIEKYNPQYAFTTWIANITVNTIISEFRKNKKLKNIQYTDEYQDYENLYELNEYIASLKVNEIIDAIKQLNEMERIILNMIAIEGYSHREVSQKLDISEELSRWYYYRSKINLKKILEQKQIKIA